MPTDPFSMNVAGVQDLIQNKTNKIRNDGGSNAEGESSEKYDALEVTMTDAELLKLRNDYEKRYAPYEAKLTPRVKKILDSYKGVRAQGQYLVDTELPIAANLQFEALEAFLAAALAKNPEPVVWSDETPEGQAISRSVKTMLQFHADQLVLRRKLALMVRQHEMYLLGVLKPGWNQKINDVAIDNSRIQDYVFDPDGYVDAYGDFSSWYGLRKKLTAEKLIEMFPKHKEYITTMVDGRLGTETVHTEWWPNDEYCFYSFKDKILDKHKNQYFKYPEEMKDALGQPMIDPETGKTKMTEPKNHFAYPKKPGIFLSVFSLQEQPHDITSNMEQNIATQNLIARETEQIDYNIGASNNGYAFSEDNFNQETGKQAANARRKGNPILIPSGGPIANAIFPLPAMPLPDSFFKQVEIHKQDLKNSWGVQGITPDNTDDDQTARGMILRQSQDSSRIGGGIGQSIEQVADNVFNWLVQLYTVFYDEKHFAAIMGGAKAVEYVTLSSQDIDRQLIVSVSPDSMIPKDEISQSNMAQTLFTEKAIGPITLLKMLSFPDPDQAASDGVFYAIDPQAYMQVHWPELMQQIQQAQQAQAQQQQAIQGAAGEQQMQQQGAQADQQLQQGEAQNQQKLSQQQQAHEQKIGHAEEIHKQKKQLTRDPASAKLSQIKLPKV